MTVNGPGTKKAGGDIRYLTSSLTRDDLTPEKIFAARRGIRSCTPPLDPLVPEQQVIIERLRRAVPREEE